jgi:hypothetical protein
MEGSVLNCNKAIPNIDEGFRNIELPILNKILGMIVMSCQESITAMHHKSKKNLLQNKNINNSICLMRFVNLK